ncbi:DUF393 domain-containing protein [Sphingobium sp. SCG-1]|uniref:thiol-disulfide oxidoreductase DCC family protein n=1 Tax=Sphingobium sp. SCG-1 TaxID=2072936 RepID=UPI000CD6B08F|nr:DCC1-like thiol-disulfide oxidoreductase family protein [Sphingobium sp. SCG-1]AUW58830.1 DUF393 domain-containing protein [Sphingobium sp. SCG-1]
MNRNTEPAAYVIYDGECPFCSTYVKFMRLRESVGAVELIDARQGGAAVQAAQRLGYDLNEGMIFHYGGRYYHGADALQMLSMLSGNKGWLNRLNATLFRSPARASLFYPFMRAGRNATLQLLGRSKLDT